MLPEVEKRTVELIIKQFLSTSFCKEEYIKAKKTDDEKSLYIRIIAKYLLLCQSQSIQNDRLQDICDMFFDKMSVLFKLVNDNSSETKQINKEPLYEYVCNFLQALKFNKVFLDQKYISCLPVFENIAMRMRKILPTEKHFALYIEIHLTMLYYKSMKQAMKQKPGYFDDLKQNSKEAVEMVGLIFGTYIGHEMKELVSLYFFSIIHIYKKVLENYLNHYFVDGDKTSPLVVYTLKGLLHVGHTEALLLVEYILRKSYLYFVPQSEENEISTFLKSCKNQLVLFLVQAYT